ncbi:MAG TPA: PAS domain-containing protein, partial [bacterium]|nr:PAS domain-containing protein [bacterium]
MRNHRPSLTDPAELRRRARQRLRQQTETAPATGTAEELARELALRTQELALLRAELLASHERFHIVADLTYDWESWLAPSGELRWVSDAVTRFTGYTPDECHAMAAYPRPIIHPDDRARVGRKLQEALRGATHHNVEFRIRRKDGSTGWCAAAWHTVHNAGGRPCGV